MLTRYAGGRRVDEPRGSSSGVQTRLEPRVLVLDNEASNRELIRLCLLPLGVKVVEADDLTSARTAVQTEVDLAIIDFYLEPEAGTDLIDDLRSETAILLLTASYDTAELRRKYPRIAAVLRKPFDSTELRSTVKRLLER